MDKLRISDDNFFPKIGGKYAPFLKRLRLLKATGKLPDILDLEGTVKLHGMHADLVFDLSSSSSSSIQYQSRNRVCSPADDQHGWPADISQHSQALHRIKEQILQTFRKTNPNQDVNDKLPLIIAGEWIGGKVQKVVGISELSHRFVLLSVSINGVWQKDSDYRNIQNKEIGLYNIFEPGSMIVKFDTNNITETNPALGELQRLADEVEQCCPFAAKYGIKNSRGEGIVWKPGTREGRGDAKLWLKTKGPMYGKENRIDPVVLAEDRARNLTVSEAAERWVTPRRLEQGFEYLLEMNLSPTRDSLKVYTEWVIKDIMVEERDEIDELKHRYTDAEKTVKEKVAHAATEAYLEEMRISGELQT